MVKNTTKVSFLFSKSSCETTFLHILFKNSLKTQSKKIIFYRRFYIYLQQAEYIQKFSFAIK